MDTNASSEDGAPRKPRLSPAQKRVIDQFVRLCESEMVAMAKHLMWQYHIDELGLAPEGAVNGALIKLFQALTAGTIQETETRGEFLKAFRAMLERFIQDEQKRQGAEKRGGSRPAKQGRLPGRLRIDADLDAITSDAPQPEAQFLANEAAEWMLTLLDRRDSSLRRIAVLSMRRLTNEEIATELGVSLSTVERRLRDSVDLERLRPQAKA